MSREAIVWCVEEWDDRKQKYYPITVFRTLRDAKADFKKRKRFYDVRIQSYLRVDL